MPARKSTFTTSMSRPSARIAKPSVMKKRRRTTTSDRICNELPHTKRNDQAVTTSYIRKNAYAGRCGGCEAALTRAQFLPWAVLVAVAVSVAHAPSFLHRLMDGDEAIYGSIAALMNTGGALYAEGGVDNKPPGIFWAYALTFRVFGSYQMTAVHAAALVVVLATCVLLFLIARQIAGERAGLLAALFFGVVTAAGNPRLLAANTEIFMMAPLAGSVLLMLRRRWFWCGTVLAAAGAFRQSAAIDVLLVVLAILWLETPNLRWRAFGVFATGLVAGLTVGAAILLFTGSLAGFWRWTIQVLYGYASTQLTGDTFWWRARDSVVAFVVAM